MHRTFVIGETCFFIHLQFCNSVESSRFVFVQILWWQLTISAKYKKHINYYYECCFKHMLVHIFLRLITHTQKKWCLSNCRKYAWRATSCFVSLRLLNGQTFVFIRKNKNVWPNDMAVYVTYLAMIVINAIL